MNSTGSLGAASARFLAQAEQVEYGEVDGIDVESRGGSNHRRDELAGEARVSVLSEIKTERGDSRVRVHRAAAH
jgi:hypothetical protein